MLDKSLIKQEITNCIICQRKSNNRLCIQCTVLYKQTEQELALDSFNNAKKNNTFRYKRAVAEAKRICIATNLNDCYREEEIKNAYINDYIKNLDSQDEFKIKSIVKKKLNKTIYSEFEQELLTAFRAIPKKFQPQTIDLIKLFEPLSDTTSDELSFTEEEKALGVGNHPTILSNEEWDWIELLSELRV